LTAGTRILSVLSCLGKEKDRCDHDIKRDRTGEICSKHYWVGSAYQKLRICLEVHVNCASERGVRNLPSHKVQGNVRKVLYPFGLKLLYISVQCIVSWLYQSSAKQVQNNTKSTAQKAKTIEDDS